MTTGTVTLSLSDVDKLRDTIKAEEAKVAELNAEIATVKADKRIRSITKYVDLYAGTRPRFKVDEYRLKASFNEIMNNRGDHRSSINYTSALDSGYYTESPFARFISLIPENVPADKISYVNLDDVQGELKANIRKEFQVEIGELQAFNDAAGKQIAKIKQEHVDKLNEVNDVFFKQLQEERKDHDARAMEQEKTIQDQIEKYNNLKNDIDTRTTEKKLNDRIDELVRSLEKEQNKKWYQKLFNLN